MLRQPVGHRRPPRTGVRGGLGQPGVGVGPALAAWRVADLVAALGVAGLGDDARVVAAGGQPVFIDEDKIPDWLDPGLKDPEKAMMLLRPIEDGEYEAEMLEEIGNDKTHTPPKPRQQNLF